MAVPARRARGVRPRDGGFTLIEVVAVLVIIGVVFTFAVLAVGDRGRADEMEREVRRLAELIRLGGDEAVLQGRELGLEFGRDQYRFLIRDGDRWLALTGDSLLRPRTLPPGLELRLFLEGLPVVLEQESDPEQVKPQVFLLSSGETSPFELVLQTFDGDLGFRLRGGVMGDIGWEGPIEKWR